MPRLSTWRATLGSWSGRPAGSPCPSCSPRSAAAPCGTGWRPGSSCAAPGVLALPAAAENWRIRVAAAVHGREAVASSCHRAGPVGADAPPSRPGPRHRRSPEQRSRSPPGRGRAPGRGRLRRNDVGSTGFPVQLRRAGGGGLLGDTGPRHRRRSGRRRSPASAAGSARRRELRSRADEERRPARSRRAVRLVDLLADGCQSELEIWGCLHVLRAPGMPTFVQQRRVTVGRARPSCWTPRARSRCWPSRWTGRRGTGRVGQREADIRRDPSVATVGVGRPFGSASSG